MDRTPHAFLKLHLWPCQDSPEKVPAAEACEGPADREAAAPVVSEAASSGQTELGIDHGKDLLDVQAGLFQGVENKHAVAQLQPSKAPNEFWKKCNGNFMLSLNREGSLLTRREQLGKEDHQLEQVQPKKRKDNKKANHSGQGRGRALGRGRGRGRGRTKQDKDKVSDDEGGISEKKKAKNSDNDQGMPDEEDGAKKSDNDHGDEGTKDEEPDRNPPPLKKPASRKPPSARAKPKTVKVQDPKAKVKSKPSKKPASKAAETEPEGLDPTSDKKISTATWAGRWVPSDPIQYAKMCAIKQTFESLVASKVRSQSSLQSPFSSLRSTRHASQPSSPRG